MCGLVGSINLTGRPDVDRVRAATRLLAHRGPDGDGVFFDDDVALGARRLAILDPSPAGDQPMASADGHCWIAFNGELYNHRELRAELEADGFEPRGTCDTEVLLELFRRQGAGMLPQLRGMFAFAAWDDRERILLLARDGFGIKPLFHTQVGDELRFASESKALAGVDDGVQPDALRRYLAFGYVPPPDTIRPGLRSLEPGHALVVRPGADPEDVCFWRPRLAPDDASRPRRDARIRAALEQSVACHLRSDAPLGALLSGGIDSAAICALAARARPGLKTFTVGFEQPGFSEIEDALRTAEAVGADAHTITVSAEEFADALPRIVWHLDDPLADAAAIPLWFVAREASRHVKVLLSGEGADELFGGYHNYREHPAATDGPEALARYVGAEHVYIDEQADQFARGGTATAYEVVAAEHARAQAEGLDPVTTMQLVDLRTWLPSDILVKGDRMSMAHGVELRVPFLDREVFAAAAGLTPAEKVSPQTTKVALRRAVADLLPACVVARPKLGFPVPIGQWLRGELFGFAERLFAETEAERYVRRDFALGLLRRHRAGEEMDWRYLWVLVAFCLWHQVHVERRYDFVGRW